MEKKKPVAGNNSKREPQLSRDSWLRHGLEVLRDEGIQGVRVERLARDLGVTKGSFYWHFTDRDDLWQNMLDYWSRMYTGVIVDNREFRKFDPAQGLLVAMTKVRAEGLDTYELAMRAWADHDPKIDAAVREVYAQRTAFVMGFFTRLGFRGIDAEVRTRLTLCYMSWELNMYPDESKTKRLKLLEAQHELLTRK